MFRHPGAKTKSRPDQISVLLVRSLQPESPIEQQAAEVLTSTLNMTLIGWTTSKFMHHPVATTAKQEATPFIFHFLLVARLLWQTCSHRPLDYSFLQLPHTFVISHTANDKSKPAMVISWKTKVLQVHHRGELTTTAWKLQCMTAIMVA